MANIALLKVELTANNHPVTGAYSLVDATAANELNAQNIDAEGGVVGVAKYIIENTSRTNTGDDMTATPLYGRLEEVADGAKAANVFGQSPVDSLTLEQIHAARTIRFMLLSPHVNALDFTGTVFSDMLDILAGTGTGAKVWKAADVTAIKALSQSVTSRAVDQGIGFVRTGDVTEARA